MRYRKEHDSSTTKKKVTKGKQCWESHPHPALGARPGWEFLPHRGQGTLPGKKEGLVSDGGVPVVNTMLLIAPEAAPRN